MHLFWDSAGTLCGRPGCTFLQPVGLTQRLPNPPQPCRLLAAIAGAIMQWPDDMLQRLVQALSRYTPSRISSLLHKLQQYVSMYLYQEHNVDSQLEVMVKFIGLLYRANEEGGMLSFTGESWSSS